jgi:hypothetical protein
MQEMRQIANAVQRGVGAGLRIGKQRAGCAHPFDAPFGNGQLDLHRTQRLSYFVVQLAGDPLLLFLTRVDEARRQPLQIAGNALFAIVLFCQPPLERRRMP